MTKLTKNYLYFICLFAVVSCINRTNTKTVSNEKLIPDSLICATINYFANDTMINEFKFCNRFIDKSRIKVLTEEDSLRILELNSIFSKEDLDFIFKQNTNSLNFKSGEYLNSKVLISYDTIAKFNHENFWTEYHKRFGDKDFGSIGLPLFSKNYTTVIIKYSRHYGRLNSGGGTFIFKKVDSHWVKIMCLDSWIS